MENITGEVITSAAKGDMGAFETIYRNASGFVYNVALNMTASPDMAAEITQDIFVKLHKELKQFRHKSAFSTWLYRITVNTSLNALKKTSRRAKYAVNIEDVNESYLSEQSAHAVVEHEADKKEAKELLDKLSPDHKSAIVLRHIEGMSYREMADTLKLNLNTVRIRLKRAREALLLLSKKGGGIHEML